MLLKKHPGELTESRFVRKNDSPKTGGGPENVSFLSERRPAKTRELFVEHDYDFAATINFRQNLIAVLSG